MAYIELSRENYFHNLQLLSDKLGSKEKLAVVLKDNAYGHGLLEMAALAKEFGVCKALVRNHREAIMIESFFPFIMILSPDMQEVEGNFSLVINSLQALSLAPISTKVHLKIDSGMHRNGIMIDEMREAFIMIEKQGLVLEGVMTHFRSADELGTEFFWQMKLWEDIKEKALVLCERFGIQTPLFHAANSAALLRQETYHDSFARCGIATYGYEEFHPSFGEYHLKPVLELWANKIATRALTKGMRVGYGGVGHCKDDCIVSTYDVGYADGIFRYDGEGNLKTTNGLEIMGRVSMDNISVEGENDKISLFGDAKALAHYHDSISYDVLVKLSPLLMRKVV